MSEFEKPPAVSPADPVEIWLLGQWKRAQMDRDNEKRHGPHAFNVGATIAGHKMQWIKELIADWRTARTPARIQAREI